MKDKREKIKIRHISQVSWTTSFHYQHHFIIVDHLRLKDFKKIISNVIPLFDNSKLCMDQYQRKIHRLLSFLICYRNKHSNGACLYFGVLVGKDGFSALWVLCYSLGLCKNVVHGFSVPRPCRSFILGQRFFCYFFGLLWFLLLEGFLFNINKGIWGLSFMKDFPLQLFWRTPPPHFLYSL